MGPLMGLVAYIALHVFSFLFIMPPLGLFIYLPVAFYTGLKE
jgi:hypothetical protein